MRAAECGGRDDTNVAVCDVDALIEWIGSEQTEQSGGRKTLIKPALTPTLLFPFAAPRVAGDLADAGGRAESEMRVLLWAVESWGLATGSGRSAPLAPAPVCWIPE